MGYSLLFVCKEVGCGVCIECLGGELGDGVFFRFLWEKSGGEVHVARIRSVEVSALEVVGKLCCIGGEK
jgi:hypothetical protein